MKNSTSSQRRRRLGALFFLLSIAAVPVYARAFHGETWARDKFAFAEGLRQSLSGRATEDRTRRDYQRVIDAYRRVYYGSPLSTKADDSVFSVAELLVEMGRQFDDEKLLRSAIGQYQFLRREYPGSKHRFAALYAIGDIYRYDLDDASAARGTFTEFLRRYPHNRLSDDAQSALAELEQGPRQEAAKKGSPHQPQEDKDSKVAAPAPATATAAAKEDDSQDSGDRDTSVSANSSPADASSKLARVTGIRYWSTDQYTRVAVDLEDSVKFDAQRLPAPERIFFDLRNTKLAGALSGKSYDVGDGLLKRIRIAQFQPGRTRVVLEVDDLAEYSAFLMTNPCRLIIDVHGATYSKTRAMRDSTSAPTSVPKPPPKADGKPSPAKAETVSTASEDAETRPAAKREILVASNDVGSTPVGRAVPGTPKKIVVEADDDDDDQASTTSDGASRARKTSASAKASGRGASRHAAVRVQGKRRSADGNDDEVATLEPADLPSGTKASDPSHVAVERSKASRAKSKRSKTSEPEVEVREAVPTASGDRSLIRALGLKIGRIVIDPGHGGHDTGTIGPNGLLEKDLVLEVAKRLGRLLEGRLGADVVYTRQDDTFIPLETRTAIANQEKADLFVSIHANSSRDPDARGVETYYLNFTSNEEALEVAARENAVSDKSIHELQDLVKKIALKEKIEESREFATEVQRSLHSGLAVKNPGIRDRGVKKAPFVVLIGANMPSILAEISFVSNPTDARRLQTAEYRQRIAESLYNGISKYVGGLSGVKVAAKMPKGDAP